MSSLILSEAMREAYASAPADTVILHTIEMWHPTFLNGSGDPEPIRVVLDQKDWNLQLESTAPRNPSATVLFQAMAFSMVPPGQTESGITPAKLMLDSVSGTIREYLELVADNPDVIDVIYRAWSATAVFEDNVITSWIALGEPGEVFRGLVLKNVSVTATRAEGDCQFDRKQFAGFPRSVYDRTRYATLS